MVFFVTVVIFLAKNLTDFLIVESLIKGYMLIASTDAIENSYIFTSSSSSLYFRSESWTMETREYFNFLTGIYFYVYIFI